MSDIQLNDPQTLYRRWEESQWNPFAIDLDRDRVQWAEMADEDRALIGSGDDGPDIERLGVSTDEVRQFALDGLTRRLAIIGVPIETL